MEVKFFPECESPDNSKVGSIEGQEKGVQIPVVPNQSMCFWYVLISKLIGLIISLNLLHSSADIIKISMRIFLFIPIKKLATFIFDYFNHLLKF